MMRFCTETGGPLATHIERSALVPFSAERMFALVNDIERYPEFIPGCAGAEVLDRGDGWLEARLDLARLGMRQSFSTRNTLEPPTRMSLSLLDGPFKTLEGAWQFDVLNEQACKVSFTLTFEVANRLMAIALPKLMQQVASEQVDAVCARARELYQ